MYSGIDSQVSQLTDSYRSNPQALAQRYQQNQELIELLALQKLKSEKQDAMRQMQMAMAGPQGTIKDQREQELRQITSQDIARQLGQSMPPQMAQGQPQRPPQGQPQQPPQQPMQQGLGAVPAPAMKMASGGIVSFAEGGMPGEYALEGIIEKAKELAKKLGITLEEAMDVVTSFVERTAQKAEENMPDYNMLAPATGEARNRPDLGIPEGAGSNLRGVNQLSRDTNVQGAELPEGAGGNLRGVNQLSRDTNVQGSDISGILDTIQDIETPDLSGVADNVSEYFSDPAFDDFKDYFKGWKSSLSEQKEDHGMLSSQYLGEAVRGGLASIPAAMDAAYNKYIKGGAEGAANFGDVLTGGKGDVELPSSPILSAMDSFTGESDGSDAASQLAAKEQEARAVPSVSDLQEIKPTGTKLPTEDEYLPTSDSLGFETPPASLADPKAIEAAKPTDSDDMWDKFITFGLGAGQASGRSGIAGALGSGARALIGEEKAQAKIARDLASEEGLMNLKRDELELLRRKYGNDYLTNVMMANARMAAVEAEFAKLSVQQQQQLNQDFDTRLLIDKDLQAIAKKEGENAAFLSYLNDRLLRQGMMSGSAPSGFDFSGPVTVTSK